MFTLVIVGRPNVGKSTLFNRLAGKRLALVDDAPGVTRDRREAMGQIADMPFTVVDTAGFEDSTGSSMEGRMRHQTELAISGADICLFMIDGRMGVTPLDRQFADLLRKSGKQVLLVANKCESDTGSAARFEAYQLGLGDPVAISAEHGRGLDALYEALKKRFPGEPEKDETPDQETWEADAAPGAPKNADEILKIAVIGRPNTGKSTLVNRLLGEQRMITGPEAGLTRDAISTVLRWKDRQFLLSDTAGMRRKARVRERLEQMSVADAKRAMDFADVAVVLIDAMNPFEKQDLQIADMVVREGRALVIAVNKWDLIENPKELLSELRDKLDFSLSQAVGAPLVCLSALSGEGVQQLLPAVEKIYKVWNRRVSTAVLNRWLAQTIERHPPPAVQGRRIKLRYMTQVGTRPPSFAIFSTRSEALPDSYARFLVNGLRRDLGFPGVPIRLHLRSRENPYLTKK